MSRLALVALLALASCTTPGFAPTYIVNDLAPTGKLRAAINYGNSVLARKDPKTGEPGGVSVDLAHELAWRLRVPLEIVPYDAAGKVTADANNRVWDIAFVAIDPARAEDIAFTGAYVIIEGSYLVPVSSPLRSNEEVDREGVRISVSNRSAYDLYLTRALKHAKLVRAPSPPASIDLFVTEKLDVLAGVRQPLLEFAAGHPEYRVIDGHFMVIEQAMGTPNERDRAAQYLRKFVEEVKASGFVAASLARSGVRDAAVAPPTK